MRRNLDVLVTAISIKSLDIVGTLFQQFLTDAAVCPNMSLFHSDLIEKLFVGDFMISTEGDAIDFVFLASVNGIDHENLIELALKGRTDLCVIKALLLKVVHEVPLSFVDQIPVDGPLRIDGDSLFHFASSQKGNR